MLRRIIVFVFVIGLHSMMQPVRLRINGIWKRGIVREDYLFLCAEAMVVQRGSSTGHGRKRWSGNAKPRSGQDFQFPDATGDARQLHVDANTRWGQRFFVGIRSPERQIRVDQVKLLSNGSKATKRRDNGRTTE